MPGTLQRNPPRRSPERPTPSHPYASEGGAKPYPQRGITPFIVDLATAHSRPYAARWPRHRQQQDPGTLPHALLDSHVMILLFHHYGLKHEIPDSPPEANANLADLYLERGDLAQAERYFETALQRDPTFVPGAVGLARVLRLQGDEQAAENLLRDAARTQPQSPDLAHALGLSLVRSGARTEALDWLRKAVTLGQNNPRFVYVYAVALHDTGQPDQVIVALK